MTDALYQILLWFHEVRFGWLAIGTFLCVHCLISQQAERFWYYLLPTSAYMFVSAVSYATSTGLALQGALSLLVSIHMAWAAYAIRQRASRDAMLFEKAVDCANEGDAKGAAQALKAMRAVQWVRPPWRHASRSSKREIVA